MKNPELGKRIQQEIIDFVGSRKSLQLSSMTPEGKPYASYAPFALGESCLYVLISEIAIHAVNLQHNPAASILIVEDEAEAKDLFARKRVNYSVNCEKLDYSSEQWQVGLTALADRHGNRINDLSEMKDFKLFKLTPTSGRFVKGFGRAYDFEGEALAGESVEHLRDGHTKRDSAQT